MFVCATAARADRLVVEPDVTVTGDTVHLSDVATLEGPAAEALATVAFGPAPAVDVRTLDGATVLATLKRAGLDPAVVTYTIPTVVRVHRATQDVSETAVRDILQGFLAETLGDGIADASIRSVQFGGPIRIPTGTYQTRVSAPPGADLVGRVRVDVGFVVNERLVKDVWVTVDIARFGSVVIARRALARGETVREEDVELDRRELSVLPHGTVSTLADAVGMVTRTAAMAYAPLTRDQLVTPAVVKRGDAVLLVVQRGGLRITAPGEAREDGARGAAVHVLNRTSHQEVIGRVQDPSTVVVDF